MKKSILIIFFSIAANALLSQNSLKLEVYYFHITNRCKTCTSIEANTRKTLDKYYAREQKEGRIKLHVLNVDEKKNKALSEKYAAFGSSLFLTRIVNKKETITDITNFAFQNSLNRPERFIKGLKEKIAENLK
jgi:hypothetical protein